MEKAGRMNMGELTSLSLPSGALRQKPDIRHHVLHLLLREPPTPGVHGAHDHAEFDAHEHLLIGLHTGDGIVEVGGRDFQVAGLRTIAPPAGTMATHAVPLVQGFAGDRIAGLFLGSQKGGG